MSKHQKLSTCSELLEEWDYVKNGQLGLDPNRLYLSSLQKVWWICRCCGHGWRTGIHNRTRGGSGCPKCAHQKISKTRLKTLIRRRGVLSDSELLKDWSPKNTKQPNEYTPVSNQEVIWECHVCHYEWKAKIANRVHGRGCPACSNKVVHLGVNDLATTHPELAAEWHPTKNGLLKPSNVTFGQSTRVWWLCPHGHSYQATVNHRSGGTGCPVCIRGRSTSFAEQAFFFYIKKAFPDAINGYRADFLQRMELDIYIPSIRLAIEYDGEAWHGSSDYLRRVRKYQLCRQEGIRLWRIKENALNDDLDCETADSCITMEAKALYEPKQLNHLIPYVLSLMHLFMPRRVDVNVERDAMEIRRGCYSLVSKSLADCFPEIAREWHLMKNGDLTPAHVKPKSDVKVWWLCPTCGRSYQATPGHRVMGTGCPACGSLKSARAKMKAVHMLDPLTREVIKTFISISEASRFLKKRGSNITSVCTGRRSKAYGYAWEYVGDSDKGQDETFTLK